MNGANAVDPDRVDEKKKKAEQSRAEQGRRCEIIVPDCLYRTGWWTVLGRLGDRYSSKDFSNATFTLSRVIAYSIIVPCTCLCSLASLLSLCFALSQLLKQFREQVTQDEQLLDMSGAVTEAAKATLKSVPLRLIALPLSRNPELIYYYANLEKKKGRKAKQDKGKEKEDASSSSTLVSEVGQAEGEVKQAVAQATAQAQQQDLPLAQRIPQYISKATSASCYGPI